MRQKKKKIGFMFEFLIKIVSMKTTYSIRLRKRFQNRRQINYACCLFFTDISRFTIHSTEAFSFIFPYNFFAAYSFSLFYSDFRNACICNLLSEISACRFHPPSQSYYCPQANPRSTFPEEKSVQFKTTG